MARGRLGRGLASLIPDDVFESRSGQPATGLRRVPLSTITPNPEQPRRHFDPDALRELADSIRSHGLLAPLLVGPGPTGGYTLIAGERRLRAAGLAGMEEVPVVLRGERGSEELLLELALVENLQREDLDPIETARGFQRLHRDFGHTQERIAQRVGKDRATVANHLRILRLPDRVLELVQAGRLSVGHAKALLGVEDRDLQRRLVERILAEELSVRATERLVRSARAPRKRRVPEELERALGRVSDALGRHLGTAVKVKARGSGGRIEIAYSSPEELERLLSQLHGDSPQPRES